MAGVWLAPALGGLDWWRERAGLVCVRGVGECCHLAVGGEVAPAGLPVRQVGAVLLPVDEGGLVAEMVEAFADAGVWFGVHEGLHRGAPGPGADAPPCVAGVGERVRAEVAVGLLGLLNRGDGGGEELIKQRWVLQRKPGNNDDRHHDLLWG